MDKIVFLATLAGKLSEYPMPAEDVEKSVASVKSFLDKISDGDFAAEPPTDDDAAEMAKELYEKYVALNSAKEEAQNNVAEPEVELELEIEAEVEVEAEPEIITETPIAEEKIAEIPEITVEDIFVNEEEPSAQQAPAEEESPIEEEAPAEDYITLAEEILLEDEPPAPEEILEQLQVPAYEEGTPVSSDEDFFEMLAKEAENERNDQARIEELELKALAMASKDDPEMVAAILSKDEKLGEMVANNAAAIDEFDPIEGAFDPEEHPDIAFEESELTKVFSTSTDISKDFNIDKEKLKKLDEEDAKPRKVKKEKKEKKEREKVKGTPLFWTLFILTLPITLPLFLAVCALFGIAYSFVTALIIGCCAAMLSVVVAGTALALIGIIYGIIECFDTVSIGLYEIGVGIIVGGVTMLVSVLLSNLAIRLIPKLYKQIGILGSKVFSKIGDLYIKIKKECGKKK